MAANSSGGGGQSPDRSGAQSGVPLKGTWGRGTIPLRPAENHGLNDFHSYAQSGHTDPLHRSGGTAEPDQEPNAPMTRGDVTVPRDLSPAEARQQAERAVSENLVPARYDDAIRRYFNQVAPTTAPSP
jgi:hypothetical protein